MLKVTKFGGSSMADAGQLKKVMTGDVLQVLQKYGIETE